MSTQAQKFSGLQFSFLGRWFTSRLCLLGLELQDPASMTLLVQRGSTRAGRTGARRSGAGVGIFLTYIFQTFPGRAVRRVVRKIDVRKVGNEEGGTSNIQHRMLNIQGEEREAKGPMDRA